MIVFGTEWAYGVLFRKKLSHLDFFEFMYENENDGTYIFSFLGCS